MYMYMYTYMYVIMYIYIYDFTYVYIYTYMCMYVGIEMNICNSPELKSCGDDLLTMIPGLGRTVRSNAVAFSLYFVRIKVQFRMFEDK